MTPQRKRVASWLFFTAIFGGALSLGLRSHASAPDSGIRLSFQGKTLTPVGFGDGYVTESATETSVVWSDSKKVELRNARGEALWSTPAPGKRRIVVVGATPKIAFLSEVPDPKEYDFHSDQILRLDIATHKWLPPLTVGEPLSANQYVQIAGASVENHQIAVLFVFWKEDPEPPEKVTRRTVKFFDEKSLKPLWTKDIPLVGSRTPGQVLLLANFHPNFADSDVRVFNWVGDKLLVCPDATGPIVELSTADGKPAWSLDRPWEFRRGFIGPSVYANYLGRFGVEEYELKKEDEKKLRQEFDKQFEGQIVGGPIYVNPSASYPRDGRIFVAVSLAFTDVWGGYTGDCILYEVNGEGKILRRTVLPQLVDGATSKAVSYSTVWSTQNNGMLRARALESNGGYGMGMQNPDCTGKLDWFTQHDSGIGEHWLSHGSAGDFTAFSDTAAFRSNKGWFADSAKATHLTFPIEVTDLKTGNAKEALLTIPAPFKIERPPADEKSYHNSDPGGIGIVGLAVSRGKLRVQIATEKKISYAEFDLNDL